MEDDFEVERQASLVAEADSFSFWAKVLYFGGMAEVFVGLIVSAFFLRHEYYSVIAFTFLVLLGYACWNIGRDRLHLLRGLRHGYQFFRCPWHMSRKDFFVIHVSVLSDLILQAHTLLLELGEEATVSSPELSALRQEVLLRERETERYKNTVQSMRLHPRLAARSRVLIVDSVLRQNLARAHDLNNRVQVVVSESLARPRLTTDYYPAP